MGSVIDLNDIDRVYRCNKVKLAIVLINLIGAPLSFLFLLGSILRMMLSNKKISFLTILIIMIFGSEIINTISKMLQLFKYLFEDQRTNMKLDDKDTPRGIICQIQIITAIFSDYCTSLTTLLLSLRCYDVIKNKIRFFDKGKNRYYSIIGVVVLSIILAIIFLFIDRAHCNNIAYRFDKRDRCTYWCWLEHFTSLICFCVYGVLLLANIYFAYKTISSLKRYQKLLEKNDICEETENNLDKPLQDLQLTKEEQKRIEELKIMKIKCSIYPLVNIGIWSFATIYRFFEIGFFWDFDNANNSEEKNEEEQQYFNDHLAVQIFVQVFLVIHTFISATKGILYGFSFIIFEERNFNNFFRICFFKKKESINNDLESNKILKDSMRTTEHEENNQEDNEEEGKKNEDNIKNESVEMDSQTE